MKNSAKMMLCLGASVSLFACSKKEEKIGLDSGSNPEKIEMNNLGMLKFESDQVFKLTLAKFDEIDPKQLEQNIKDISKKFVSYRADTLDDNKNPWDFDPTLSRVLSKDGAVQVGDSVYFFTQKTDYKIAITDKDLLDKAILSKDFSSNKVAKQTVVYTTFSENDDLVKKSGTSTSNYNGSYQISTPEVTTGGRPERATITLDERKGNAGIRFNAVIYGQAYRKGGLFGAKKWREDEINDLIYDMIRGKSSARATFEGPFYNLRRLGQYETKFFSTDGPLINNYVPVEYLDVDLKTIKKNSNSAIYSVKILIDKYANGQRYLRVTTSW
ncbi:MULTISPECIES: hypothetical protein [Sphingobacterium]|uniref:DUF4848 domain-containing protein n=1 Tax=Sphingobacterium kitahiroshimense TaxID=470446 RepID=A0ABV0BMC2_9SPHI|nr:hypothetical protein [Sphingobacterium sp. JUb56]MBB2952399.1 hypothetical protein [Sphingobacterium sp. JUb56]